MTACMRLHRYNTYRRCQARYATEFMLSVFFARAGSSYGCIPSRYQPNSTIQRSCDISFRMIKLGCTAQSRCSTTSLVEKPVFVREFDIQNLLQGGDGRDCLIGADCLASRFVFQSSYRYYDLESLPSYRIGTGRWDAADPCSFFEVRRIKFGHQG